MSRMGQDWFARVEEDGARHRRVVVIQGLQSSLHRVGSPPSCLCRACPAEEDACGAVEAAQEPRLGGEACW